MASVLGIILGGGRGGRLFPLTKHRSKPAVPIAGKYRLIDIPVSNCIHSGIARIFVLTQFNSASLNRHINLTYKFDAFHEGFVDILAAEQTMENADWFQGTADAVRKSLRHFQRFDPDHYLILAGDHLYQMDYRRMLDTHLESKADITVAVSPVSDSDASQLGILKADRQGRITDFVEKPARHQTLDDYRIDSEIRRKFEVFNEDLQLLGSMGVYLFRKEVLHELLTDSDHADFGKEIIPAAIQVRRVQAHVFTGYWRDVGTIQAFYESNLDLVTENPHFHFFTEPFKIFTHARFLPASKIRGLQARNALICEGCLIEDATLENALIGVRTVIQKDAVIKNSYIMGSDYYEDDPEAAPMHRRRTPTVGIGEGSHINGAIVDKNARIGKGVIIGPKNPDENTSGAGFMVKDGITIIEKDAVIPDRTVI
jgi:glucose-1-phosphate adenylyltransferase